MAVILSLQAAVREVVNMIEMPLLGVLPWSPEDRPSFHCISRARFYLVALFPPMTPRKVHTLRQGQRVRDSVEVDPASLPLDQRVVVLAMQQGMKQKLAEKVTPALAAQVVASLSEKGHHIPYGWNLDAIAEFAVIPEIAEMVRALARTTLETKVAAPTDSRPAENVSGSAGRSVTRRKRPAKKAVPGRNGSGSGEAVLSASVPSTGPSSSATLEELERWERSLFGGRSMRNTRLTLLREGMLLKRNSEEFRRFLERNDLRSHEFDKWKRMYEILLAKDGASSVVVQASPTPKEDGSDDEDAETGEGDDGAEDDAVRRTPLSVVADIVLSEGDHRYVYDQLIPPDTPLLTELNVRSISPASQVPSREESQRQTHRAGIVCGFQDKKWEAAKRSELEVLRQVSYDRRGDAQRRRFAELLAEERLLPPSQESSEYGLLVQIPEGERSEQNRARLRELACELFGCQDDQVVVTQASKRAEDRDDV